MSIFSVLIFILSLLYTVESSQQNFVSYEPLPPRRVLDNTSSDPDDIGFYLYPNPNNPEDSDILEFNDTDSIIKESRYNSSNPVILLIHGYTQNYTSDFPVNVRDAYLESGFAEKANIIAVDWGKLSSPSIPTSFNIAEDLGKLRNYILATNNVPIVGRRLADFLIFLMDIKMLTGPDKVHLVGQSLGAHCSGMAGLYFRQSTSKSLARITGTDPAKQLFQGVHINQRLDPSDALNVQILHSNQGEFGYMGDLGSVDFYMNGRGLQIQPGCKLLDFNDLINCVLQSRGESPWTLMDIFRYSWTFSDIRGHFIHLTWTWTFFSLELGHVHFFLHVNMDTKRHGHSPLLQRIHFMQPVFQFQLKGIGIETINITESEADAIPIRNLFLLRNLVFCSHNMAPRYFAETIRRNNIEGYRCKFPIIQCLIRNFVTCGEYCPATATGSYDVDIKLSSTRRGEL